MTWEADEKGNNGLISLPGLRPEHTRSIPKFVLKAVSQGIAILMICTQICAQACLPGHSYINDMHTNLCSSMSPRA